MIKGMDIDLMMAGLIEALFAAPTDGHFHYERVSLDENLGRFDPAAVVYHLTVKNCDTGKVSERYLEQSVGRVNEYDADGRHPVAHTFHASKSLWAYKNDGAFLAGDMIGETK